jgi:hypothetical protein
VSWASRDAGGGPDEVDVGGGNWSLDEAAVLGREDDGAGVVTGAGALNGAFGSGAGEPLNDVARVPNKAFDVSEGAPNGMGDADGSPYEACTRKLLRVWTWSCFTLKTPRIITPLISVNNPRKEG